MKLKTLYPKLRPGRGRKLLPGKSGFLRDGRGRVPCAMWGMCTPLTYVRCDFFFGHIEWHINDGSELCSSPSHRTLLSQLPRVLTMEVESQRPKGQEDTILALNNAIEASNPAKVSSFSPAMAVFGSVSTILTLIRVCFPLCWNDPLQVHT
jgi:hypothetical protein